MNSRERFHATFRYGQPDRVFLHPQWTFPETRERWLREGMPWDVHFNTYFGFDRMETIPLNLGIYPPLETRVVEQTTHWRIVEDELGGRAKHWTDRHIGMPQWISYPVGDRESWEKLKQHLDPDAPNRYPEYWDYVKRCYAERDFPLGINGGSYYGWLRNWVGMENLALWYYDCPDLVHEMTEFLADFVLRVIARALDEVPDIDYGVLWEDMAMKTGPLISPKLFRDFMLEPMKRVTEALGHAGIEIIMVDSDGHVDELIPLWLEADVNLIYPLEVAASCDAREYQGAVRQGSAPAGQHRQAPAARRLLEGPDRAGGGQQGPRPVQAGRLQPNGGPRRAAGRAAGELPVLHGAGSGDLPKPVRRGGRPTRAPSLHLSAASCWRRARRAARRIRGR